MAANPRQSRPWGFGLFTRIVYVHQAVCLAFFVAGLRLLPSQGIDELVLPHLMGIAFSLTVLVAMFVVTSKKSLRALSWLRVILWLGVVKILIVQLWLLAQGEIELISYIRAMLINELVAISLAVYWSRSAHSSYLASLRLSAGSAAD
ncbi:hypothetical protein KBY75_06390 [Cyanobium sp. T1G-Tous]|uniref:hypothetical protein n=1 Tax=Cyanobium sp. T1G-Tous TaxID=2823722 RepID=UPI0020CE54C9|nr:hypothetical protein [Cyanobium sp. T1G-Tous]MCP9803195.1 hypothetical protein [Cyanobium sp. T1G-Tous]